MGLRDPTQQDLENQRILDQRIFDFDWTFAENGAAPVGLFDAGFESRAWWSTEMEPYFRTVQTQVSDEASYKAVRAQLQKDLNTFVAAVTEADEGGAIQYSYRGNFYTYTKAERARDSWEQLKWLSPIVVGDLIAVVGSPVVMRGAPEMMIQESLARSSVPRATTVLGHAGRNGAPGYVELADAIGARRFAIPDEIWRGMTPAEQWAANQRFLDRMIRRGDDIALSTPARKARPGSFFARELEYLAGKGYTVSPDGSRLLPPAR